MTFKLKDHISPGEAFFPVETQLPSGWATERAPEPTKPTTLKASWRPREIGNIIVVKMEDVPEPPERVEERGEWRDKFKELCELGPGEAFCIACKNKVRLWHVRRVLRQYAKDNNRTLYSSRSKDYMKLYVWLDSE